MALNKTGLIIKAAPLPADFCGTPQDLFQAMIERMEILSPVGTNFFVVGDIEPSSDVGPWLRGGTQWWVFSATEKRYVPLDISASLPTLFFLQDANPGTPGTGDPLIWLRTSQDRIAGLYGWNGSEWKASGNIPNNGTTTQRPTAPADFEEYFDTDINVLLRFERGAWRTAAGSPGDVKSVTHLTLELAVQHNPGWSLLGLNDQSQRGRLIGQAAKDPGATPVASFVTDSGITARFAGEEAGEETHILISAEHEQHTHLLGHATALNNDNNILIHRVDDAEEIDIPPIVPPNHFRVDGEAGTNGTKTGTAGTGPTGTMLITSRQLSNSAAPSLTGAALPHNTLSQTLFLWTLVKD